MERVIYIIPAATDTLTADMTACVASTPTTQDQFVHMCSLPSQTKCAGLELKLPGLLSWFLSLSCITLTSSVSPYSLCLRGSGVVFLRAVDVDGRKGCRSPAARPWWGWLNIFNGFSLSHPPSTPPPPTPPKVKWVSFWQRVYEKGGGGGEGCRLRCCDPGFGRGEKGTGTHLNSAIAQSCHLPLKKMNEV